MWEDGRGGGMAGDGWAGGAKQLGPRPGPAHMRLGKISQARCPRPMLIQMGPILLVI